MNNQRPEETWSVERLGKFCSLTQKKLAVDAWRFGHALNLARTKHKNHGDWQKWKKQYVPGLSHSSEHRYRNLARGLTEDSLEGVGLTEAYRLLDLTYTKNDSKNRDAPLPDAPVVVVAGSDDLPPDDPGSVASGADEPDDDPDDSDDLAGMPQPTAFSDLPPATGLMEDELDPPQKMTGPLEASVEPACRKPVEGITGPDERSADERYRLHLMHGRSHLTGIQTWADWLMGLDEGTRFELWQRHRVESGRA